MFSRSDGIGAGRIHDNHTALSGAVHIDSGQPGARPPDNFQRWRLPDQIGIDRKIITDDQRGGGRDRIQHSGCFRRNGRDADIGTILQQQQRFIGQRGGN